MCLWLLLLNIALVSLRFFQQKKNINTHTKSNGIEITLSSLPVTNLILFTFECADFSRPTVPISVLGSSTGSPTNLRAFRNDNNHLPAWHHLLSATLIRPKFVYVIDNSPLMAICTTEIVSLWWNHFVLKRFSLKLCYHEKLKILVFIKTIAKNWSLLFRLKVNILNAIEKMRIFFCLCTKANGLDRLFCTQSSDRSNDLFLTWPFTGCAFSSAATAKNVCFLSGHIVWPSWTHDSVLEIATMWNSKLNYRTQYRY